MGVKGLTSAKKSGFRAELFFKAREHDWTLLCSCGERSEVTSIMSGIMMANPKVIIPHVLDFRRAMIQSYVLIGRIPSFYAVFSVVSMGAQADRTVMECTGEHGATLSLIPRHR